MPKTIANQTALYRDVYYHHHGMALYLALLMCMAAQTTPDRTFAKAIEEAELAHGGELFDRRLICPMFTAGTDENLRPDFEWEHPF